MERCKPIGTWSHGLIGTHTHWCGMGLSENTGQRSWRHLASRLLLLARLPIKRIPGAGNRPHSSGQLCCSSFPWRRAVATHAAVQAAARHSWAGSHGEPQPKSHYAEGGRHLGLAHQATLSNGTLLPLTQPEC